MKFTALTNKEITALQTLVDLSADKLDQLNKMLDGAYAHRVELSASDYCGFDVCIDEVVFERVSNETGDTLKAYSVKFDAEELTIDDDYEWSTDYDGGYGVYRALPKVLRQHIELVVWLSAQIDAEQERLAEEQSQDESENDLCNEPEEINYTSNVNEAKMKEFNGYPSWNAWNVNLWINNTFHLYGLSLQWSEEVRRGVTTMEEAIDGLIDLTHQFFKDGKTPDGAVFDRESCKEWLMNNHFED